MKKKKSLIVVIDQKDNPLPMDDLQPITEPLHFAGTKEDAVDCAKTMVLFDEADVVIVDKPLVDPYDSQLKVELNGIYFPIWSYRRIMI